MRQVHQFGAEMIAVKPGDRVRDGLGHWYDVLEVRPDGRRLRVQALTPVGTELRPLGAPLWCFRSDMRADGE